MNPPIRIAAVRPKRSKPYRDAYAALQNRVCPDCGSKDSPPPGRGFFVSRRRAPSAGKPDQEIYHMSTIGAKIDQLALREQKRALEEQIRQLSGQMDVLENDLIDQMDKEGVSEIDRQCRDGFHHHLREALVDNWDAFYAYIHRYKYYHLLERRPSVTGCRELLETKGKIPGSSRSPSAS